MVRYYAKERLRPVAGQAGFTLIEVLTALIIMSVATSIFISYFLSSKNLAEYSRAQRVAAQLAEERIADIQNFPGRYYGTIFDSAAASGGPVFEGETLALVLEGDEMLRTGEPPAAMPTVERAYERTKNLYEDFIWRAYVHKPPDETTFLELVLVVHWIQAGRPKVFALTAALPADTRFEMMAVAQEEEAETDTDTDAEAGEAEDGDGKADAA